MGGTAELQTRERGEADAQIPVGAAGKMFIKGSGLEQNIQPHEEIGALDVLALNELLAGVKFLRDCVTMTGVARSLVPDEPRRHHVQVRRYGLVKARLDVLGLPRVVVIEDGDEPEVRLPHDARISMKLVDPAVPSAGCTRQRSPIAHHGHGTVFAKGLLNLVSESLSRDLGELYLGLINDDHQPVGQV